MFNLGVLNGPDLEIMEAYLKDPTSIEANLYEAYGGTAGFDSQLKLVRKKLADSIVNTEALLGTGKIPETQEKIAPVVDQDFEDLKARLYPK